MKLQGIVFFLCGGLTFAFNLHLRTKAFLCSPQTLNYPIPIRAGRWEYFPAASLKATASTPPTVNRNGSVQSVRRFFLKFLKVLVKHPLNLFSRVISISEFKSFMEIATALDSNEKDTIPKIITTNGSNPADKLGRKSVSPEGERWAVAAIGVEFSGKWQLHADNQFKEDYNRYLANLGQPLLVRTVALGLIGRTKEDLRMSDDGKSLFIRGENAKGIWERELVTSGTEVGKPEFEPLHVPIMTADSEKVEAESWWEGNGTIHVSILHGVSRYHGGGTFESRRYLEDDGNTYVCISTFHFKDVSRKPNSMEWRFRRIQ